MGYQLYWVMLCGLVAGGAAAVTPNGHGPPAASAANCGGAPGVHVVQTPETVVLQTGAVPTELKAPGSVVLTLRSAGSCSNRMAFGLTGLGTPAFGGV